MIFQMLHFLSCILLSTHLLIREVLDVIEGVTLPWRQLRVVGIVSRPLILMYKKNISINTSTRYLCLKEGMTLVDPQEIFYRRLKLFLRDGIHLNDRRKTEFARIVQNGDDRALIKESTTDFRSKFRFHGCQGTLIKWKITRRGEQIRLGNFHLHG